MNNRQNLIIPRCTTLLMALILILSGFSTTLAANTSGFRYQTSHWTTVDINLAANDGLPLLLSFYSEGANGLRLLENVFTDNQGSFNSEMRLPAHLRQVVVVARGAERQDTFTLPIGDYGITYSE